MKSEIVELGGMLLVVAALLISLVGDIGIHKMLRDCRKAHGTDCHVVAMPIKPMDRASP